MSWHVDKHNAPMTCGQTTETVGQRVRRLRKEQGLSQVSLAAKVGVSQPTISTLEKYNRWSNSELIDRVSAALGITVDELFQDPD